VWDADAERAGGLAGRLNTLCLGGFRAMAPLKRLFLAPCVQPRTADLGSGAECRLFPFPCQNRLAATGPDCAVASVTRVPRGMAHNWRVADWRHLGARQVGKCLLGMLAARR
jgi:hypothetical protein